MKTQNISLTLNHMNVIVVAVGCHVAMNGRSLDGVIS